MKETNPFPKRNNLNDALAPDFFKKYEKTVDKYGNNINFPDKIMSDMTTKGLLGKQVNSIFSDARHALFKYHMKSRNIDYKDKCFVLSLFKELANDIATITPILEDFVEESIFGIQEIFAAVYGKSSDEVYVLDAFLTLYDSMDNWNEDEMWTDCATDTRLRQLFMEDNG